MYTISFEIAALILSLFALLYSLTVRRRQYLLPKGFMAKLQSQHSVFILVLLSNLLASLSSVGGVYLQGMATEQTAYYMYLLHALYFFFHSMLAMGFALYIMNVTGAGTDRSKVFWILFFLPFLISELLILTNRLTGLAFYLDESIVYHRGPLILLLYAFGALYVMLGFIFFFRYKKAISRADSIAIGVVIILATLGIVTQAVRPDLLVELFFEALAFHVLLMILEERGGHIDTVTGALNRIAFSENNRRILQSRKSYSLVLVKLSNTSLLSSLFGDREMDTLQSQVAAWLTGISSEQDLYCYRENYFAIARPDPDGAEAKRLTDEILRRFEDDWYIGSRAIHLDASVGVVRVPEEVSDLKRLEELLATGIKTKGLGSRLVAFGELDSAHRDRAVESALRRAVAEHRLRVWYQPIWSAEQKRTIAAEALLRVDDEFLRTMSPEFYIPIAERTGLIREIGLFIFEDVCRFLRDNAQRLESLKYVELNLSLYQFLYDDMVEQFERLRDSYGVEPSRINLELTETASMQDSAIGETMRRLLELGYSFSLDDFGTGCSNLQRLVNDGFTTVKIDKSLLWDARRNENSARLLDSLIRVIRGLDFHVVQEGVETEEQLARVIGSGCDLIQGYLFSRPVPEEDFLDYLAGEQRRSDAKQD